MHFLVYSKEREMKVLLICLAFVCFCSSAYAKPRRQYSHSMPVQTSKYSIPKVASYTVATSVASDQERCQAEANYMAANNISGHVWGCIGRFEGVGCGYSPNCQTCVPSGSMTLTGDASAQGRNGMWYRVRSWR